MFWRVCAWDLIAGLVILISAMPLAALDADGLLPRVYGLDVFVVEEGSADYAALLQFFQRGRSQPRLAKGILRVDL